MSVRKRSWTTSRGEPREAWIVDYVVKGSRHIETFKRKRDADAYHASVTVDVAKGIHTPESRSLTVAQAAEQWLTTAELERLERSTVEHYRTHVARHIVPRIGATRLATLTTPMVSSFRDALLRDLSRATARKVLVSFRSIIKDARRLGTIAHNVAEGVTIGSDKRAARCRKSVAIFRPQTKFAASWQPPPPDGGPFLRWRPLPACVHLNCAVYVGATSILQPALSTCASGPMNGAASVRPRHALPNVQSQSGHSWSTRSERGSWPARTRRLPFPGRMVSR
jgi:hypothetical protein